MGIIIITVCKVNIRTNLVSKVYMRDCVIVEVTFPVAKSNLFNNAY